MDNNDFAYLAHEIKTIFPNETIETYYVKPIAKKFSKNNKSGLAKGKLVDKYRNKRTFIREVENLKKKVVDKACAVAVNPT